MLTHVSYSFNLKMDVGLVQCAIFNLNALDVYFSFKKFKWQVLSSTAKHSLRNVESSYLKKR